MFLPNLESDINLLPDKEKLAFDFDKLVILIDSNTCSSSEILAMILKQQLEAMIVGGVFKGKWIITKIEKIENYYIKIPVLKVKGYDIGKGIIPDIYVKDNDISKLIIADKVIFKDINATFKTGDIVWVKGDSGTGKSTLLKLLLKFRLCDKILINDEDIRNIKNISIRNKIRYLSQEVPIIKGTLRENIFFNIKYDKNLEEKLKSSFILKIILKTKTMDTIIDENGANLSGGEKQKNAISILIFDDSDVLVLDGITSNIDRESFFEIMEETVELSKNKIIFITSHDDFIKDYVNKELILKK